MRRSRSRRRPRPQARCSRLSGVVVIGGTPEAGPQDPPAARPPGSLCEEKRVDLEVELVDVVLVEDRRRPEQDAPVGLDGLLPELARVERLTGLARDDARGEVHGRDPRQRAELARIPELEALNRAVLDELAHLVRRAETGQLDLALVLGTLQVARGGRDAHGGGGDDALEIRVGLQETLGLLEGLLVVVVAVG